MSGEPFGEGVTFVTQAQDAMTAAGRDQDGGAGGLRGRRKKGRDRGIVHVRDVAFARVVGVDLFRLTGAGFGAGRAVRPERDGFGQVRRLRGRGDGEREEGGEERGGCFHEFFILRFDQFRPYRAHPGL